MATTHRHQLSTKDKMHSECLSLSYPLSLLQGWLHSPQHFLISSKTNQKKMASNSSSPTLACRISIAGPLPPATLPAFSFILFLGRKFWRWQKAPFKGWWLPICRSFDGFLPKPDFMCIDAIFQHIHEYIYIYIELNVYIYIFIKGARFFQAVNRHQKLVANAGTYLLASLFLTYLLAFLTCLLLCLFACLLTHSTTFCLLAYLLTCWLVCLLTCFLPDFLTFLRLTFLLPCLLAYLLSEWASKQASN